MPAHGFFDFKSLGCKDPGFFIDMEGEWEEKN